MYDESIYERFYAKIAIDTNDCWLWTGYKDPKGYGYLWFIDHKERAYRVSYLLHNGKIPEGKCVLHKCDIPACVNPSHLFLGSRLDNHKDMIAKRRAANQKKTACKNGHHLTAANVYLWVDSAGKQHRFCRECRHYQTTHRKRN